MTRLLTVDDSRAVRMLVKKALVDMGFEIVEAEDGEKGLLAVDEHMPDLILLDVTMPVLDGPGMLERLRARGNNTPVLLLTAESGTSVIGPMLKQGGISDYIVKPFKPEQLRAKVIEALQRNGTMPSFSAAPQKRQPGEGGFTPPGKSFVDLLVIDDMENVAKKLKSMLPERISFNSVADRGTALSYSRERVYRAILLDTEIPDVDSTELLRELRILQPTAAFIALVMRTDKNPQLHVANGFSAFLIKPFDVAQVEEFVGAYFESQDLLGVDGNVLRPAPFKGAEAAAESYFKRLQTMTGTALQDAAAACHDRVILDLAQIPPSPRLQKYLVRVATQCSEVGLEVRVVANADVAKLLKQLVETAEIPVAESVEAAKAA